MENRGRYIGGSIANTLGLMIAIIGIIVIIGNFVYHDIMVLIGGVLLLIVGIIISAIGYSFKNTRNP